MRLFEWIIALSSIGMLWHVIWSRKQLKGSALKIFSLSMITCIVLHLIVEGGRWQMAPAYLLCAIVLLVHVIRTLRPSAVPGKGKLAKIALSTAAVPFTLLAIGLPVLFPVFALNQPSGPYPVGTITFEWTDETRESASGKPRKINVQIWYPAKITDSSEMAPYIDKLPILAKAMKEQFSTPEWMFNYLNLIQTNTYLKADFADVNDKKLPVVFFSHSNLLGARFTNTFQTSELASHGYIVASIEHPRTAFTAAYSDGSYVAFEDFFSRLPMEFEVQNKASIPVIKDQVRDIEFALGQMKKLDHAADNPFAGKIDFLKIGLFGHSFGGATIIEALYDHELQFKAGINMDGTLYGRDRVVNLKQPVLLMYGDKSIDGEMTETMASEDQKRRDRALGNEGYVLNIGEAGHLNFTDLPLYSPLIGFISPQAKRNHRIINETTVCFFDTSLKGLPDRECESSIRKYPDIRFKKGN